MKQITPIYGLFLLITFGVWGCGTGEPSGVAGIEKLFAGKETLQLQAKPTLIRSEDLTDHGYITCIDSLLLNSNRYGDRLITVYNLHTGGVVNQLIPKGKAKNELLGIGYLSQLDDQVMVYGQMPPRVCWISKTQLLDSFPSIEFTEVALDAGRYMSISPVDGGRYVATGRFDAPESQNHQFAYIDSDGKLLYTFEDYLLSDDMKGLPNYNLAFGYQGVITTSADGRHGLYSGWNNAIWRFYDFSGEKPRKIKEYAFVLPTFSPREGARYGVKHSEEKSIGGSIFATASKEHYYLLFSDKPYGAYSAYFTDQIYVFDLQGEPVKKIKLDRELIAMTYWAEQNALLGCALNEDGEPQILQFDL